MAAHTTLCKKLKHKWKQEIQAHNLSKFPKTYVHKTKSDIET